MKINPIHKKRIIKIILLLMAVSISATFILFALRQNISLYYTPTQLEKNPITHHQIIRVGGKVVNHSVQYFSQSNHVEFLIADTQHKIEIDYQGILPALFRVGQTVVVQGYFKNNVFHANQVLAKHGSNYHQ